MLHIFHVDSGSMITLEMTVALESVAKLKLTIQDEFNLPAEKQVLLISGGECLNPNKRVCSYTSGTDTNPIFLFSKTVIEAPSPPLPIVDSATESDIDKMVREHCDMPVTFSTVAKRSLLAQHLVTLAKKQLTICENLVHDQHLQQQGWSAVVANLEDITADFRRRSMAFEQTFREYMAVRETYVKFLGLMDRDEDESYDKKEETVLFSISPEQHEGFLNREPPNNSAFKCDLDILQRIPILPMLLKDEDRETNPDDAKASEGNEEEAAGTSQNAGDGTSQSKRIRPPIRTLLDWISYGENKYTMDNLFENCSDGLEQFDMVMFKSVYSDIMEIISNADNSQMKEVKGLEERLSGLETLMREAKKFVNQQTELAQSFALNQYRASNTKDSSVLPDLCNSHKRQLAMMASNHAQLCDIRRRCAKAKEELSMNLYHRLKWVMYIEDYISETDQRLVVYHENLHKLLGLLDILQQIHLAPATYLCAIAEVVRRRTFSQHFLLWASELACHLLTIHNEEVAKRKEFQSQFTGSFLNALFPGMEDMPPSFATQPPPMFDISLPKLTEEDIDRLKMELPDMADNLNVPDSSALTNFFLLRSLTSKQEGKELIDAKIGSDEVIKAVEEKLIQAVNDVGLASDLDRDILREAGSEPCLATAAGLPHLKDLDRGCESETDTEEFEKVGQSPLELNFDKNLPSPRPRTQDASTSTEDNLQISRSEHNRLTTAITNIHQLAKEATANLKFDLTNLKTQILTAQNSTSEHCDNLASSLKNTIGLWDQQQKMNLKSAEENHEQVVKELKQHLESKSKELEEALKEKELLEGDISKHQEALRKLEERMELIKEDNTSMVEYLQQQLVEKEEEKVKMVKETSDRLIRDHKAELESIRSRFKLMTMERSPSDLTMEKMVDMGLPNTSKFLQQMKDNFEMDKEKAILKERQAWDRLLNVQIQAVVNKCQEEKTLALQTLEKEINEEKDKQIEALMKKTNELTLECSKHKRTIQQMVESAAESSDIELLKMITTLQNEKDALIEELESIKSSKEKVTDLSTSLAVLEAKVDVTTSPMKQKADRKSEAAPKGMINVESCRPGDKVVVCWDKDHENFRIIQEKQHLYFLHSGCLSMLGLEVVDGQPNKYYCIGEVFHKEYCFAKKSDNRYRVPKCTKFFRVKVQPPTTLARDITQSLYQPSSSIDLLRMTQSQSSVASSSEDERPLSRLLPVSPIPVIMEDQPDGADVIEDQTEELASESQDIVVQPVQGEESSGTSSSEDERPLSRLLPVSPIPVILEEDQTDGQNEEEQVKEIVVQQASQWPDQHFAEDSGIVDNVEEAMAALDNTLTLDGRNEDDDMQIVVNKTIEDQFLVV